MKLYNVPNDYFIDMSFKDFISSHHGNLFFFANKEGLKYNDCLEYAKHAINYVCSREFSFKEINGDGEVSVFYSNYKHYRNVSLSFIEKILIEVFGVTFHEVTELSKDKSNLPIMYKNDDNPYNILNDIYVYKSNLHKIVVDFVLFYIFNSGITLKIKPKT